MQYYYYITYPLVATEPRSTGVNWEEITIYFTDTVISQAVCINSLFRCYEIGLSDHKRERVSFSLWNLLIHVELNIITSLLLHWLIICHASNGLHIYHKMVPHCGCWVPIRHNNNAKPFWIILVNVTMWSICWPFTYIENAVGVAHSQNPGSALWDIWLLDNVIRMDQTMGHKSYK